MKVFICISFLLDYGSGCGPVIDQPQIVWVVRCGPRVTCERVLGVTCGEEVRQGVSESGTVRRSFMCPELCRSTIKFVSLEGDYNRNQKEKCKGGKITVRIPRTLLRSSVLFFLYRPTNSPVETSTV